MSSRLLSQDICNLNTLVSKDWSQKSDDAQYTFLQESDLDSNMLKCFMCEALTIYD